MNKKNNDDFTLYNLSVSVIGDKKKFMCSHVKGIAFEVVGENLIFKQKQFSMYSLAALIPLLPTKERMTHPNDWMTTDAAIACPDPHCSAQFKIERTGKKIFSHSETSAIPLS